jgi:hypothetical protein
MGNVQTLEGVTEGGLRKRLAVQYNNLFARASFNDPVTARRITVEIEELERQLRDFQDWGNGPR